MNGETRVRISNRCRFDIGITLSSGQQAVVRTGSFLKIPVDDILYIESTATGVKPFSAKWLVPVSDDGKDLTLEDLGGYTDPNVQEHLGVDDIMTYLKKSAKSIEVWLESIDDPVELHSISEVASSMDLPASKLKVLKAKMPYMEFLDKE